MARPLREQDYPGATHHVFHRGVARSALAVDADDYTRSLSLLERTVARFELRCHAWCFLPNHFHLLVTSELGNLSSAMHWLGTCTAQSFNERHERSGHLYQGRYGSRLVRDDAYLLELARYVPLNPVRAGLSAVPEAWPWSSYAATAGLLSPPRFLDAGAFMAILGSSGEYVRWVSDGFAANPLDESGAPRPEPKPPLADLLADDSDESIARAHVQHGHSRTAIAERLGISLGRLDRRLACVARTARGPDGG